MARGWNKRTVIIQNKYINSSVPQSIDSKAIPIGRGRSIAVTPSGDLSYVTCIEILAKKIAQTRWKVYGDNNKEVGYLITTFNKALNVMPYPSLNAYSFWEYIEKQRLIYGNGFAYISSRGLDIQLVPLDAAYVTVYWDDANILDAQRKIWYQYHINDGTSNHRVVTIPAEDVLHFRAFSTNGIVGRRSVDVLRETLQSQAEVDSAMRSTVVNGYAGTILLTYTSDLSQSKREVLQEQVKEFMRGGSNLVIPLPAGVNVVNVSNDVKAYHETLKKANAEDISALFGIPLVMLNKGSGSGVATLSTNQMTQIYKQTFAPIIEQYAREMTCKLLTPKQMSKYRFDDSADDFDYLDAEAKSRVINSYVGSGILTRNEARTSLEYPLSDDPNADKILPMNVGGMSGDSPADEGGRPPTKGGSES